MSIDQYSNKIVLRRERVFFSFLLFNKDFFFSSVLYLWKERKKNEKMRDRELSNNAFNHSLDFLRLTHIVREENVSSCLVITLSLCLLFFSSGAPLYDFIKSRFRLLFLFFLSFSFFLRVYYAQHYDNFLSSPSMFACELHAWEYWNSLVIFFV